MEKMWAGRFAKSLDSKADDFNSSISFDCKMYRQDITGSMAHAEMLAKQGIISLSDCELILDGLKGILEDIDSGKLEIDMSCEDIHMFVEAELTRRIGDAGKRLHTARSRNDQVALDIRMYLRDRSEDIISLLRALIEAVADKAEQSDLEAAVARISKNETDIAANASAIGKFNAITPEEVEALFA